MIMAAAFFVLLSNTIDTPRVTHCRIRWWCAKDSVKLLWSFWVQQALFAVEGRPYKGATMYRVCLVGGVEDLHGCLQHHISISVSVYLDLSPVLR